MAEPGLQDAVTSYWDARAPRFDGAASHVAQQDDWLRVFAAALGTATVLDVVDLGTGTGACALLAARLGHRVRGYDGSAGMIAVACAAAQAAGLAAVFEVAVLQDLADEPGTADIVCLRNLLWTLERPAEALVLARRLLRPGGRVLVSDGLWSVAPQFRSTYPEALAARLPLHGGLSEATARNLLAQAGFGEPASWRHLFAAPPYPGGVPMFVLTAPRAADRA